MKQWFLLIVVLLLVTSPAYAGLKAVTATSSGGGGSGTVTSITAGTGLTGGTITTSGTIALGTTAVTAGSYTNTNLTVNAQGQITASSNGGASGLSIGTTAITGGTNTYIEYNNNGVLGELAAIPAANGGTGTTTLNQIYYGSIFVNSGEADGGQALNIVTSTDGKNFNILTGTDVYVDPNSGVLRDPSIVYYGGKYYVAYTDNATTSASFGIATSTDFLHWTYLYDVSASSIGGGANQRTWAPEFFVDSDNSLHIFFAGSATGASTTGFQIYAVDSTASIGTFPATAGAWSTPTIVTGTSLSNNIIDPFVVKVGSTYNIWYADVNGSGGEYVSYMSSSSRTSGYTVTQSGNWAGWGHAEGPSLVQISPTDWRIYFDEYLAIDGINYSDSTNNWVTWNAAAQIQIPSYLPRHGTIVGTTNLAVTQTLAQDAIYQAPGVTVIQNGSTPPYLFNTEIGVPTAGIQFNKTDSSSQTLTQGTQSSRLALTSTSAVNYFEIFGGGTSGRFFGIDMYTTGSPASITNSGQLEIGYDPNAVHFIMQVNKNGSGVLAPLAIDATGSYNEKQIYLTTTGGVGVGTTTIQNSTILDVNGTIETGVAGATLGSVLLAGNTSGVVSVIPQAAAGTYNFNLPITVGTSGYALLSGGGGSTAMTWSAVAKGSGGTPTCGTGCASITAGSTDLRGSMVSSSSVSSVTLNFSGTLASAPFCTISDSNTSATADISSISTSALTVSLASALTSVTIYWNCPL